MSPDEPYRVTELRMSGQKQKQCKFNQIEPASRCVFHRALVTGGAGQADAGLLQKTVHELGDAEERAGTVETALSKLRSRHLAAGKGITSWRSSRCRGSSKMPSEE